jgi:hypothetical protein
LKLLTCVVTQSSTFPLELQNITVRAHPSKRLFLGLIYRDMAATKQAIVKSTGQRIEVYRLNRGGWANYSDCKTEFQDHELDFIKR